MLLNYKKTVDTVQMVVAIKSVVYIYSFVHLYLKHYKVLYLNAVARIEPERDGTTLY